MKYKYLRIKAGNYFSHQYDVDDDSWDFKESSIESLAGQNSVAEIAATKHQKTSDILHMPRMRNDWRQQGNK